MFEYFPGSSLFHRLDVRTKAVGFLALTLLSFLFTSPLINLLLALLCLALALSVGISFARIQAKLKPLIGILFTVVLMAGFSYPPARFESPAARHLFFSLFGTFHLTTGGLLFGLTLMLRILIMVLASSALIYCTPLNDFLQLLQKMAMPYQLAFVFTTAIRFIPTMEQKTENILDAQRARGAQIGSGKIFERIQTYVPIMIPMMVVALRISDQLAVGMLNRGYGARVRATPLKEIRLASIDYLLIVLFLLIIVAGVWLNRQGFGRL
ncbi:MAG: energy-coupling factor transporter transmembrane protein EcfT [Chloroflexi bacterium]|nr:MAG: energy-coupling factor transporter transmembrane protein EcfT [Chloroflexota bacterium]